MKTEVKIVIGVGVIVVGLGVLLFTQGAKTPSGTTSSNVQPGTHNTTSTSAKVQVVEFGDFQCPACFQAEPVFEKTILEFQGNNNVNFSFRNFPLPQHQFAQIAAEAAEAAGAQGKYWEMHNKLYTEQNTWVATSDPMPLFIQYATAFGLNIDQFKNDVSSNKYKNVIDTDQQAGTNAGVNATPTFYVNGKPFVGVPSDTALSDAITAALK